MWLLFISVAALFAGPLLGGIARRDGRIVYGIDGFVLVAMGGLVLLHLLPHSLEAGGGLAALAAVVGLGLPLGVHRLLHGGDHDHDHSDGGVHEAPEPWLLLALAGLALLVHAVVDGTALAGSMAPLDLPLEELGHGHAHGSAAHAEHLHEAAHGDTELPLLAGAVLLHRLPIGIALWWALAPRFGRGLALGTLAAMAAATAVGFFGGSWVAPGMAAMSVFQAFVAGALLHVIFHTHVARPQDEPCGDAGILGDSQTRASGFGAILGIITLVIVDEAHPLAAALPTHLSPTATMTTLLRNAAPALVAVFALVGVVRGVLGAQGWLAPRSLAGGGRSALWGMVTGLGTPLRTCGLSPRYARQLAAGVSPASALATWVAGSTLGLDAIGLTLALAGVGVTAARVLAVAAVSVLVGWLLPRLVMKRGGATAGDAPKGATSQRKNTSLKDGLRYGFIDFFDAVMPWILVGVVLAGLAEAMWDLQPVANLPPAAQRAALTALGLPFFFTASGATPLAAIFLHNGISVGATVAFLVTAAGTSITGAKLLARLHGRRAAAGYLALLPVLAFGVASAIDASLSHLAGTLPASLTTAQVDLHALSAAPATPLQQLALIALGLGLFAALLRRGPRGLIDRVVAAHGAAHHHGPSALTSTEDHHGHDHPHSSDTHSPATHSHRHEHGHEHGAHRHL